MIHRIQQKILREREQLRSFSNKYKSEQLNKYQKKFKNLLKQFSYQGDSSEGILMTQLFQEDYYFPIRLAAASHAIAKSKKLKVYLYDLHIYGKLGWKEKDNSQLLKLIQSKDVKIQSSYGNDVLLSHEEDFYDQEFIQKQLQAIKGKMQNGDDLLQLKFEGILVGDLIYDTYLRFYDQVTFTDFNKNVIRLIEIALNTFYLWKDFLKKHKVKVLLNSYTSYIQHGIPARVCLSEGVEVYTVGAYQYTLQKLTIDYPYHGLDYQKLTPNKKIEENYILDAQKSLESRFEGKIDEGTFYMKESAYSNSKDDSLLLKFQSKQRNIVIFAHDFFDAPHCDRCLQFPDLYLFLKETLHALIDLEDTNVWVKIHPGSSELVKSLTQELIDSFQSYEHIRALGSHVSNKQLIELKPDLVATARGSVGLEMAYFGIPVVALYDNPYVNFKFIHTCYSRADYFAVLKGINKVDVEVNRNDIFSFYHQCFVERRLDSKHKILKTVDELGFEYDDQFLMSLFSSDFPNHKWELEALYCDALSKSSL